MIQFVLWFNDRCLIVRNDNNFDLSVLTNQTNQFPINQLFSSLILYIKSIVRGQSMEYSWLAGPIHKRMANHRSRTKLQSWGCLKA